MPFSDPLLASFELPLIRTVYAAGFPVRIATNSPAVLEAAEESWGLCGEAVRRPPLDVRIAVAQDRAKGPARAPAFRMQQHLMAIVADAAHFAVCDAAHRFAFCWTTEDAVADRSTFRWYFLEALVYSLVTQCEATAVHAACVALDGKGVLLCGPSGAGKSTLAYACARHGWTFVSDDAVLLPWSVRGRAVRGHPHRMRLRDGASELFPELAGRLATLRPTGKMGIEVPTAGIRTAPGCAVERLVFLDRRGGPAGFTPVPRRDAYERLARDMPLYGPAVMRRQIACLRKLVRAEAVALRYEAMEEAVEKLTCLVYESAGVFSAPA